LNNKKNDKFSRYPCNDWTYSDLKERKWLKNDWKCVLTIETSDGQKGFFEVRVKTIEEFQLNIGIGDEE
jgi:hypothetical protein